MGVFTEEYTHTHTHSVRSEQAEELSHPPFRMATLSLSISFSDLDSVADAVQSPANHPVAPAVQCSAETLADMVRERDVEMLRAYGGIGGLADRLGTSLDSGMLDDPLQIQKRRQEFGANTYPSLSPKGFFRFLLAACKDRAFFYIILCAVHSFPSGMKSYGAYEVPFIAIIVFLLGLVVAFLNYRRGLQFVLNKNEEMQNILVNVVRGGRTMQIPISALVVGDTASLEAGDKVPADGLFAEVGTLRVDMSATTGEGSSVPVNEERPFLLSGCKVIQGSGKMLVTGVGIKTERGCSMLNPLEEAREETSLQVGLNGFTACVSWIGLAGATLLLFVSALLAVNVAAFSLNFMAAVSVGDVALIAVKMLWVSLIMDTLGVLAFVTDHPSNEVLQRPQHEGPLISDIMFRNLVVQALHQVVILSLFSSRAKTSWDWKGLMQPTSAPP